MARETGVASLGCGFAGPTHFITKQLVIHLILLREAVFKELSQRSISTGHTPNEAL